MIRRKLGFLGALSAFVVAAGCGANDTSRSDLAAEPAASGDELSESFTSCTAATSNWNNGQLTIDASASKTGVIILAPSATQVKVNGRVCKTSLGAAITAVSKIKVTGRPAASDTFVLDFSGGKPSGTLLQAGGIVIDGGEPSNTTTPDTVIVKGSGSADPVTVGLEGGGNIDVSLTPWTTNANSKATMMAHIQFQNVGRLVQGPFQPNLVFGLAGGDDTFSGTGKDPLGGGLATISAIPFGMSVFGGSGNDTIIGGSGSDKIDGGGDPGDAVDYSARSTPVYVDMDTAAVTVWGGNLRGVVMETTDELRIDPGSGTFVPVVFGSEATPAAIVSKINTTAGLTGVASIVGGQLRLSPVATKTYVAVSTPATATNSDAVHKLGLRHGYFSSVGNDGTPATQSDIPWTKVTTRANATKYYIGDVIVPIATNGRWYKATATTDTTALISGTSAAAEPATFAGRTNVGDTVVDGQLTWTCMGNTLDTRQQVDTWQASTAYVPGQLVKFAGAPGYWFQVKAASGGTSRVTDPSAAPIIPAAPANGATYTEGTVTWTVAAAGGGEAAWAPDTTYALNDVVAFASVAGKKFTATTGGKSGLVDPTARPIPAVPTVGNDYTEGTVTWTCMGTTPTPWTTGRTAVVGEFVTLAGAPGYYFKVTTGGAVGATEPSSHAIPAVPTVNTEYSGDGTVKWTCTGRAAGTENVWTSKAYILDDVVTFPGAPGFKFKATQAGTAGANDPSLPVAAATTADGAAVLTCVGPTTAAPGLDNRIPALVQRADSTAYAAGDVVVFSGNPSYWFKATNAGVTKAGTPATIPVSIEVGSGFYDGDAVTGGVNWVCGGRLWAPATTYTPGDVIWDPNSSQFYAVAPTARSASTAQTYNAKGAAAATDGKLLWTTIQDVATPTTSSRGLATPIALGDYAVFGGRYYKAVLGGKPALTEPTSFLTAVGSLTPDGDAVWKCMGTAPTVALSTMYSIGNIAYDGTSKLIKVTGFGTLTSSAVAHTFDTDITWTPLTVAEGDDIQNVAVIKGGDGADILLGNIKANTLYGNAGNDILSGGPSSLLNTDYTAATMPMDTLNGGAGNDLFDMGTDNGSVNGQTVSLPTTWDGNQTIIGDLGTDVVDYSRRSAASQVTIALTGNAGSGDQAAAGLKENDKIGADVEIVLGGSGNDKITGTANADFLFGGPGDDWISAGAGDDHLFGGAGNDKLYGEAGSDTVYELNAYPVATAFNEPLAAVGSAYWAGLGLMTYGSDQPAAGDDVVFGGTDLTETNKVDFTDAANPVQVILCTDKATAVTPATGVLTGGCAPSAKYNMSHDGTLVISSTAAGNANTYVNVEYVAGALFQANTIVGTANNETLEGGWGVDILQGQDGIDSIFGYPDLVTTNIGVDNINIDILCGGKGDDEMYAGALSKIQGEGQSTFSPTSSFSTDADDCYAVAGGDGINMCFGQVGTTMTNCLKGTK